MKTANQEMTSVRTISILGDKNRMSNAVSKFVGYES